jgi:hypothetical protein
LVCHFCPGPVSIQTSAPVLKIILTEPRKTTHAPDDAEEPAKWGHGVCEFLERISKELSKIAYDNGSIRW